MTYPADKVFSGSLSADTFMVGSGSNRAELTVVSGNIQANGVPVTSGVISYTEFTGDVTINTTTEASAVTIVTAPAFTANGTDAFMIEFFTPQLQPGTTASESCIISLWDGSTDLGWIGNMLGSTNANFGPAVCKRRLTPTAASHTYSIRGHNSSGGNSLVHGSTGGIGANFPGYILITKST